MIIESNGQGQNTIVMSKEETAILAAILCKIGGDPNASGRAIIDDWLSKLITNGLCIPNEKYINREAFDFFRDKMTSRCRLMFDEGIYEMPFKIKNEELIDRMIFK